MRLTLRRGAMTLAAFCVMAGPAFAQSSLGIGTGGMAEAPPATGLFGWIFTEQRDFFRQLQDALKVLRDDGGTGAFLMAISFAYGVFHAAGPGHGKAVISSWMLANDVVLRRGIAISFASALAQAVTAIVLVGSGFLLLRGTGFSVTTSTVWLENLSFALVFLFGLSILWRKLRNLQRGTPAHRHEHHHHAHAHDHHKHDQEHNHHDHHHHDHAHCDQCGHSHAPDPVALAAPGLSAREVWGIILAVGIRPCTGAIVVLSFALLNGLCAAGIASVLFMALGTAITVSALAVIAVKAKGLAKHLSGESRANQVGTAIEIAGALALVILGGGLLWTSLTA